MSVITRHLKTPKSARTEFAAAADLAERERVTDMKQSEVSGVPGENSKINNIRGKWTGFRIKGSIVNTNCFQSVVVVMTCVSFIVLPSTAAVSHGKSSSAGTCSEATMDKRRHTVCLWNVFIRMMRVTVNNEIWKNACNVYFRHNSSTCFADDGIRRGFHTV